RGSSTSPGAVRGALSATAVAESMGRGLSLRGDCGSPLCAAWSVARGYAWLRGRIARPSGSARRRSAVDAVWRLPHGPVAPATSPGGSPGRGDLHGALLARRLGELHPARALLRRPPHRSDVRARAHPVHARALPARGRGHAGPGAAHGGTVGLSTA